MQKMIKWLRLINYQGHRDTTIHFSPGITGIIGISMSGKTSIVRAFRWLKYNRPPAFKFHSKFTDSPRTKVQMGIDNAIITANKTSAKTHTYKINDKPPFRKIGTNVPDEVTDLINIEDINIQYEWDAPFLITGSHGEMAKVIAKAIQTDILEKGISKIRKQAREVKSEQKVISKDIEGIKLNIDSLQELEDVEPLVTNLKDIRNEINSLEEEKENIEGIIEDIESTKTKINKSKKVMQAKPMFDDLLKIGRELKNLETERKLLENIQNASGWITTAEDTHEEMVAQYIGILKKEKKCPTCFGPLNSKTIKRIKNEIRLS